MTHNERNSLYYYTKREELIKLLGGKCAICGETNHSLLEFDHINPFDKNIDVSSHITSTNVIQNELNKLQLLCINCHKNKTINEDTSRLKKCGFLNPNAKLTFEEIIEIREKYIPRVYSYSKLANEYNVSKTTIIDIIKQRIRKDN